MRHFIESRFFVVALIVCLALAIIPSTLSAMGLGNYVSEAVSTVFSPMQKLFSYVADGISGFSDYFTEYDRLVEENEELREMVEKMREEIHSAEELEQMNNWLFGYLELKKEHTDFTFEPATVTGTGSGNYKTVLTLDCGTDKGVDVGMTVVTQDGIVGHIVEAGASWSKAVTLIESGSAVGATIERTGETGLIEGDFHLSTDGMCKMTYLSADSDICEGDRIMTTGAGSVYPGGLVIGYVAYVEDDPLTRTKIAYINASADLTNLKNEKVMVITDYKTVREAAE